MVIDIPFIKLFQTSIGRYFYDVGKNEIIRVNEKVFDYLHEILQQGVSHYVDEETQLIIRHLTEQGYLSNRRPLVIEHTYTNYLPLFLDRKIAKITLQLTQQCNFRCKYCLYSETTNVHQRNHSEKRMSFDLARRAVDFLWDHSIDSPRVNIGFYGGEPLIEFDLLKRIVEYAEVRFKGKPLSFNVTTNGSLLDDEKVEFFAQHDISTMISLDGPKEINDQNRVFINGAGTFDTVISNIRSIKERFPEFADKIQISMVIDPINDFECINSITIGCSDINFSNLLATIVQKTDEHIFYADDYTVQSEYHYFLAFLAHFGIIPEESVSIISQNRVSTSLADMKRMFSTESILDRMTPGGPCIPGQMRLLINADGDFYPCERVNESEAMRIGSITEGFDYDKARSLLNIGSLTQDNCSNCWAIRHCVLCAKMADGGDMLSADIKKGNCALSINTVVHKLRSIVLLREIPEQYKENLKLLKIAKKTIFGCDAGRNLE